MRVGALVQNFAGFPETGRSTRACVDLACRAEAVGLDSVWVTDHVVLPRERQARYPHNEAGTFPYRWGHDIHEPLVLMGALAQATERVEIGAAVLVIPYRHPLTTAKMLATADQLAEGRIILGAGVGWLRDEFVALGLPDEVYDHRGGVTEDHLQAMVTAWTVDGPASHDGRWSQFADVGTFPQPARRPHIPIWVGGQGEQALRRTARLGQGHLAIGADPPALGAVRDRLRVLVAEAGRDPDTVTLALIDGIALSPEPLGPDRPALAGTPEQIAEGLEAFARAGLDHLVAGVRWAGDPSYDGAVAALETVAAELLDVAHSHG